jgi:hypothetical protein
MSSTGTNWWLVVAVVAETIAALHAVYYFIRLRTGAVIYDSTWMEVTVSLTCLALGLASIPTTIWLAIHQNPAGPLSELDVIVLVPLGSLMVSSAFEDCGRAITGWRTRRRREDRTEAPRT